MDHDRENACPLDETRGGEMDADQAAAFIALLHRIEPLKHLPRAGWVDRQVAAPESVAAHSWRLAVMAWLCAEAEGLDAPRAMRLALIHDLPEALTGDSTPFDDRASTPEARRALAIDPPDPEEWRNHARHERKHGIEQAALDTLLAGAPPAAAAALRAAWEEYEERGSAEARLVAQLDKLEAYVQGWEYARGGRLRQPQTLNSFRVDIARQITLQTPRALLRAVEAWAATPASAGDDAEVRPGSASAPTPG